MVLLLDKLMVLLLDKHMSLQQEHEQLMHMLLPVEQLPDHPLLDKRAPQDQSSQRRQAQFEPKLPLSEEVKK